MIYQTCHTLSFARLAKCGMLLVSAASIQAAPITAIETSQNGVLWSSSTSAVKSTSSNNELLSFTVDGTTYTTGVNDTLANAEATAALFRAFNTTPGALTSGEFLTGWGSSMDVLDPYPSPTWFLSDGARGLELATAVFNAPAQKLTFAIEIPVTAGLNIPAIITTQTGQPGTTDIYYFIDSNGDPLGLEQEVSYSLTAPVAEINWKFRTATGGNSIADGNRPLRMLAFTLEDFGLNSENVGQVVGFVQVLNGASDLAFVAYNEGLLKLSAPDLAIDLSGLGQPLYNQPYDGFFICRNIGAAPASAGTSCEVDGLPMGLTTQSCTLGNAPWNLGDEIPIGGVVTCDVAGTSSVQGEYTVNGSTSGHDKMVLGGHESQIEDSDINNNSATVTLSILTPDLTVAELILPSATVHESYVGSFSCTNIGNAAAAAATCVPTGLPNWTEVACTPEQPVELLGVNDSISCLISGTPTADSVGGPFLVTIETTSTTPESETTNNSQTANMTVFGVPNVQIDLSGLPLTGTVGQSYSGSFQCSNAGSANASSAPCVAAGLPDGLSIDACTISPGGNSWASPSDIPVGITVTCSVTGQPTTVGTSEVNGTGGTAIDTTSITVNAAPAVNATPVPTLGTLGLMALASAIGVAGVAMNRRRKP